MVHRHECRLKSKYARGQHVDGSARAGRGVPSWAGRARRWRTGPASSRARSGRAPGSWRSCSSRSSGGPSRSRGSRAGPRRAGWCGGRSSSWSGPPARSERATDGQSSPGSRFRDGKRPTDYAEVRPQNSSKFMVANLLLSRRAGSKTIFVVANLWGFERPRPIHGSCSGSVCPQVCIPKYGWIT